LSVDPLDESLRDLHAKLRDALITICRLSDDSVDEIEAAMRGTHMSFAETAIQVGRVTPNEVQDAMLWVRRGGSRAQTSVVETAIRRQAEGRAVTLRHAAQVRPGSQLILVHEPDNPRSERLRALRTELMLLLSEARNQANLIALLSPCAAEGRTQLAAEMAIAFSQLGRRTLLVDADLRRPRQHKLFGTDNQWGLAQALAFGEPPKLLGVEGLPQLSLLLSGPLAPNPLELLSDGRFEQLMSEWRYHYQFVVIDTPPVSEYADGLAIATLAGAVLVVGRAAQTAHRSMKEMLRRLASTKSRILGAVINEF
jgi:receptor protein-tyrosine kinase